MHPLEKDKDVEPRDVGDMTNLFWKELLEIFGHATNIVLESSCDRDIFRISLESLLSIIEGSSVNQITLILGYDYNKLRSLYDITFELKEKFKKMNYIISDLITNTGWKNNYVQSIISKEL